MAKSSTPTQADLNKRKPTKLTFKTADVNTAASKGARPAAGTVGMTMAMRKKLGY